MKHGLFFVFLLLSCSFSFSQEENFRGTVDFTKDISSFRTFRPLPSTLYLLTGSAGSVRILSQEPFLAEVDFLQATWEGNTNIVASHVLLQFSGAGWKELVQEKRPRTSAEGVIFPYRKFQAAVLFDRLEGQGADAIPVFKVLRVPVLF